MFKDKRILAIIPARGGSKGLPGKNIKPLVGKPLIGWTIEQAISSKYVDEIYVSTDSIEIAKVAEEFGIKVPELRPAELASDNAPSASFIIYTIEKLEREGKNFDYIILLKPTSPLREVEDIDNSIEQLILNPEVDSIVGVSLNECAHPSFLVSVENGLLKPYLNEMKAVRRQDNEVLYFFEGTIYISRVSTFLEKKSFYHRNTMPYYVPKWKSFEIDDTEDWFIIESILKNKTNGKEL